MPRTITTAQEAAAIIGGLTPAERDTLLAELNAQPETPARARVLSPRERVTAALMRERDHFDGCPVFTDLELGGARTEAYDETRPAQPGRGIGARPVAIIRCLECGGSRYLDDTTVAQALTLELAAGARATPAILDATL